MSKVWESAECIPVAALRGKRCRVLPVLGLKSLTAGASSMIWKQTALPVRTGFKSWRASLRISFHVVNTFVLDLSVRVLRVLRNSKDEQRIVCTFLEIYLLWWFVIMVMRANVTSSGYQSNSQQQDPYRKSNHRHWCPYCKLFISPTKSVCISSCHTQ